jgi:oxygen-dependent protoporphyrinogen oxidase
VSTPGLARQRRGRPGDALSAGATAPHVVVVGGGISGLAAAHRLASARERMRITLLEASGRLGGKVISARFGPHTIDLGAESLMVRAPALGQLCRELDLEQSLVTPSRSTIHVYARGALRELPAGILGGLPDGLAPLLRSGILSPAGIARAALDLLLPPTPSEPDCAVAQLVGKRLGKEALERLFDPLLGTIYGASCAELSLRASAPQIATLAREHRSLIRGLLAAERPAAGSQGPPLRTLAGGLEQLVGRLAQRIAPAVDCRLNAPVVEIARERGGLRLTLQRHGLQAPECLLADRVVIATPAAQAARLLEAIAPQAASELSAIRYTRAVTVALRFASDAQPALPDASGLIVPEQARRALGACTFLSAKWPHLDSDGELLVRCALSRTALERADAQSDREIVGALLADLREILNLRSEPLGSMVARFPAATPIYAPSHHERIARVEAEIGAIEELALAGAAYHGIGVPQCIESGQQAAAQMLVRLGLSPTRADESFAAENRQPTTQGVPQ